MKKISWMYGLLLFFLFLIFLIRFRLVDKFDSVIVEINDGKIVGKSGVNSNGEKYYSFLGIPYAKPPLGSLRFKAPQPIEPWKELKDARKFGNECVQKDGEIRKTKGSEDCLNINVFTKVLPQEDPQLKPVMVYIHGGQFLRGSNNVGPDYLLKEDIVLVSINYRLGLLGFLVLNDTSLNVPGNAGLKDQILALKWVKKNIKAFNGDPDRITIFGISAGAVSIDFILLSPLAKNLFHGAIIQSGSVVNPWAIGTFDPVDFCRYLGQNNLSEKEIFELLINLPAEQMIYEQDKYLEDETLGVIGPVIEKPSDTAFITKHPIEIIRSGQYNSVPVIQGYNSNEGIYFDMLLNILKVSEKHKYRRNKIIDKVMRDNSIEDDDVLLPFDKMLPYETDFNDPKQLEAILKKLFGYYFKEKNKENSIRLSTDAMFVIGIITSAINKAKTSKYPVYLYRFSLITKLNKHKSNKYHGACHGDDKHYLFPTSEISIGEDEKIGIHRMVKLWTNFAKYGNPTPNVNYDLKVNWKSIQNSTVYFLDIDKELELNCNPEKDRTALWKEIYNINPKTRNYL